MCWRLDGHGGVASSPAFKTTPCGEVAGGQSSAAAVGFMLRPWAPSCSQPALSMMQPRAGLLLPCAGPLHWQYAPGLGTSLFEAFSELLYSVTLPAPILPSLCLWVSDLCRGLKVPQVSLALSPLSLMSISFNIPAALD